MKRPAGIVVFCCLIPVVARAGVLLEDVRSLGSDQSAERFEVSLGEALGYVTHTSDGTQSVAIRLHALQRSSGSFYMKEMSLDGTLSKVSLEGSDPRGYVLEVVPAPGGRVTAVSQPDPAHIVVAIAVPKPSPDVAVPAAIVPPTALSLSTPAPVAVPAIVAPPLVTAPTVAPSPVAASTPVAAPAVDSAPSSSKGPAAASDALAAGRAALARHDAATAIVAFTAAAKSNDALVRGEALEMLGVAREASGQKAQAKAAWEQYLTEYPNAPDAARVQQRLLGLVTRDLPNRAKLRAPAPAVAWNVTGNFSQFYQRQALNVSQNGTRQDELVGIDALFSDGDVAVERHGEHMDLGVRVAGGNVTDFDAENDGSGEYQLSVAYVEAVLDAMDATARLGRQSRYSGGVLGRFDGALVAVSPWQWLELAAVGGYPVRSAFDRPDSDHTMFGVNATLSTLDGRLELTPFWIQQETGDLVDRRAVGLETRYFSDHVSMFGSVDYDVFHDELNNLYLFGNVTLPDDWRLYATVDHRRSPYITTENALIGQPYDNLSELEREYTEDQILTLAADRTMEADIASLGFDKRIAARYDVGADYSLTDYSETPASGDVAPTPSRRDYNYTLRFGATDLVGKGSYSSMFLRYADSEDVATSSVYVATRFSLASHLYLMPRVRADYQDWALDQTRWRVVPSLRIDWRRSRALGFEIESGYEWSTRESTIQTIDMDGYYVRLGYRSLF